MSETHMPVAAAPPEPMRGDAPADPQTVSATSAPPAEPCGCPSESSASPPASDGAGSQGPALISVEAGADGHGVQLDVGALGQDVANVSLGVPDVLSSLGNALDSDGASPADAGLVSLNVDAGADGLQLDAGALGLNLADVSVDLPGVLSLLDNGVAQPASPAPASESECADSHEAALVSLDVAANDHGLQVDAGALGLDVADISLDAFDAVPDVPLLHDAVSL